MPPCPCGAAAEYDAHCGRLHAGEIQAATAEQLMRARYSAFAVGDEQYLLRTWHPSTRPRSIRLRGDRWHRLEVLATTDGDLLDTEGTVEFRAHHDGGALHELSHFARDVDGRWQYTGPLRFEVDEA